MMDVRSSGTREILDLVELLLGGANGGVRNGSAADGAARVRQGLAYARQGEFERAVIEFTAAIQADKSAAVAYVHRGQALRLEPNNLLAHMNRGLVYRLIGRADEAIGDLTEALRIDPHNVVALNARGSAHADVGRYDL